LSKNVEQKETGKQRCHCLPVFVKRRREKEPTLFNGFFVRSQNGNPFTRNFFYDKIKQND